MKNVLIVVDMQNDFIDGALANPMAQALVKDIANYVNNFNGLIVFTMDTHGDDYLDTREGKHLPIPHCITFTKGWEINNKIYAAAEQNKKAKILIVNKSTFSAGTKLYDAISRVCESPNEIQVCGTCSDICVVSNVLSLVEMFKNANIVVLENLCAGLTKEKHNAALEVMRSCQVDIISLNLELRNYIISWTDQYGYLDKHSLLSKCNAYDVAYDLKADIETSKFNEASAEDFDNWFDDFLEKNIIPILVSLDADKDN